MCYLLVHLQLCQIDNVLTNSESSSLSPSSSSKEQADIHNTTTDPTITKSCQTCTPGLTNIPAASTSSTGTGNSGRHSPDFQSSLSGDNGKEDNIDEEVDEDEDDKWTLEGLDEITRQS